MDTDAGREGCEVSGRSSGLDETTQDHVPGSETVPPATPSALGSSSPDPSGGTVALVDGRKVRTLTMKQAHEGWKSERIYSSDDSMEVFISPHGKRYRRVKTVEEADLIAPAKTPGLRDTYLASIEHWVSQPEAEE